MNRLSKVTRTTVEISATNDDVVDSLWIVIAEHLCQYLSDEEILLCDFMWSTCFHSAMANSSRRNSQCKPTCLPDCQGVSYETEVTSEFLNEDTMPL